MLALGAVLGAVASNGGSTLSVLRTPDAVQFDAAAGPLPLSMVPSVVATAFGVRPSTEYSWAGLYSGSLFDRPAAAVTVIVDGAEDGLEIEGAAASYPLTHPALMAEQAVAALVTGKTSAGFPAVASVIADATGRATSAVSASASADAARAAGHQQRPGSGAVSHTMFRHGGRYIDEATNAPAIELPSFSPAFLGTDATFDETAWTVTYKGVEFPAEATAFFQELQTAVAAAGALDAGDAPAVATVTVTTYAPLVRKHGADSAVARAGKLAIQATIALISEAAAATFHGDALVLAVGVASAATAAPQSSSWFAEEDGPHFNIVEHIQAYRHKKGARLRRAVELARRDGVELPFPNNTYAPQEACVSYSCDCYKAFAPGSTFHGRLWTASARAREAGAKQGCLAENNHTTATPTPCLINATDPTSTVPCDTICAHQKKWCPCNATNFDKTFLYPMSLEKHKCTECALGYKVARGECYLEESQLSATLNIGLWTGLGGVAAVTGTWYALHTIGAPLFSSLPVKDGLAVFKMKAN